MQSIQIVADGNKVKVTVDGIQLTDLHSFSLDYAEGCPLFFSCAADVGKQMQRDRILH